MQAKLARFGSNARHQLKRGMIGVEWVYDRMLILWRWLNSLDIPLSALQWILVVYLIFGLVYAISTPAFEANDELWHFGYVEHLRKTGSLPVQKLNERDTLYRQHGSQPPLYYSLMALASAPISIDDSAAYRQLNPYVARQQPGAFGNKNLTIHDVSRSPLSGTGLAVHFLRLLGLALGAGTIFFVYRIGGLIAPQRPTVAFVAAAITGFNPMFIFVTASVNNDALAMFVNGALVWLLLRTLRDGFSLRFTLALALLFALSSLTKLTGLALLPVLLGVAFFAFSRTRDRRGLLAYLYVTALFWLLIAGWWYFRNLQLYGEPFGIITMADIAGPRDLTFSLADLFAEYQQFRMSFWGLFGALNIQLASVFYLLLDLLTFLSVVGCVFLGLQLLAISDFAYARYELAHLLTLASALMLLWLGVLYWSTLTRAAEGRMLFPLIAVVSPLMAVGFVEIVWWLVFSLRPPNLEFVRAGDAVPKELLQSAMLWQMRFLALVAFLAPFTLIVGQYSAPQPVEALPERARPLYAEFGDVALIGYERVDRRYSTGDLARFKLYWQVRKQSASDNSIHLNLIDDRGHEIGRYVTFPGAGSLRTSRWTESLIYPDEYVININRAAYGRYPFYLRIEWREGARSKPILAKNVDGGGIEPVLLDIGAVVSTRFQQTTTGFSEIPLDSQPVFGGAIRLESFKLDLELNEITLNWKAESSPEENYRVFAHLLDADGNILSQDDNAPRLPTKYWRWGESFTTFHRFDHAFNMIDFPVAVGLYIYDGLSYPKLEYTVTLEEDDEDEVVELVLDSFTIPWAIAAEVIELTPTAAPTGDGTGQASGDAQVADAIQQSETAVTNAPEP
ncbi:MAG: hypothetical protein OXI77_12405 [Chloroflexota bacterium]|nr:hypothetical protein [Chloroflexota bacterium]MDE2909172.1 hypothetical protein [Chloroflexota bacterium]